MNPMANQENLRVIFTEKADAALSDILKSNGLQESEEEFFSKLERDEETKESIVRDAATVMAKKIIPEKKIIELLGKHLEIRKHEAEQIANDIKNNVVPLLKIYPDEKFNDPIFREKVSEEVFGVEDNAPTIKKQTDELLHKIRSGRNIAKVTREKEAAPYVKKVPITDVEENAKTIQHAQQRKEEVALEQPEEEKKVDPYKEPVE